MSINQAIVSQVLGDVKNGQLRRCLDMGFSSNDLLLMKQPELVNILFNTTINWCSVNVNQDVLQRLLSQCAGAVKEVLLIDRMLKLDASSKMICEVFGLSQREVAFRRSILGLRKRQGRWTELTEKQENELWRYWLTLIEKYQFDVNNERDLARSCMWLAEERSLTMAQTWQAIRKWVQDGLHQ